MLFGSVLSFFGAATVISSATGVVMYGIEREVSAHRSEFRLVIFVDG